MKNLLYRDIILALQALQLAFTAARNATIDSIHGMLDGANVEIVRVEAVRKANAQAKSLNGLVAVFVGGTGGIGESTVKEMFLRTTNPRAIIVGR